MYDDDYLYCPECGKPCTKDSDEERQVPGGPPWVRGIHKACADIAQQRLNAIEASTSTDGAGI